MQLLMQGVAHTHAGPAALREGTFRTQRGAKGEGTALGAAAEGVLAVSLLGKIKPVFFFVSEKSSFLLYFRAALQKEAMGRASPGR